MQQGTSKKETPENTKNTEFRGEIRCFVVEISGIEPLLFVCLKDSQGKEKTPTFRLELVEISGIEPLTS